MADEVGMDLMQCSFPLSDVEERESFTCVEYPGERGIQCISACAARLCDRDTRGRLLGD